MGAMRRGFTLIELLVVIAIIALLAALLFPVFSQAKRASHGTACLSTIHQIELASAVYLGDSDDVYPQTRQSSSNPAIDDVSGGIDEPIYQPALAPISPYLGLRGTYKGTSPIMACDLDDDPFGRRCIELDPDSPEVTSYLVNGYFVFGLNSSSINEQANTIHIAERRSDAVDDFDPYCDDIYHPWFTSTNTQAPEVEMVAKVGAIATDRHFGSANYSFADGHAKALQWGKTYSPPTVNMHVIR